jgi:hypothetical protein
MIHTLPGFIFTYWYYLLGAAVVCAVLCYFSETFFGALKKAVVVLVVVFIIIAGYELLTGNSIFNLPGSVEREFSTKPEHPETGHRYYKSYEERYGEKPPD